MKRLFSIVLIVALITCLYGCAAQNSPSTTQVGATGVADTYEPSDSTESSQDTTEEPGTTEYLQEDPEMEQTLRDLVDSNYLCITTMFYYGALPYDAAEDIGDTQFATVQSDEFDSLEALKSFLSQTYTQAEVDRLLSSYTNGSPLYVEDNGVLKIDLSQASFAGMPAPWESYSIEIVSQDDNRCVFTVRAHYPDDPLREGPSDVNYSFCAVQESGWKLTEMVSRPEY